jgi:predicted RNase H-like nuclease (RuvC/YqgF family)
MDISSISSNTISTGSNNDEIKLLQNQLSNLEKQVQQINESKSDSKTKQEKIKVLQQQIQQINMQIQQIQQKRTENIKQKSQQQGSSTKANVSTSSNVVGKTDIAQNGVNNSKIDLQV